MWRAQLFGVASSIRWEVKGRADAAAAGARQNWRWDLRDSLYADQPTKDAAMQTDAADIDAANGRPHSGSQGSGDGSSDADRLEPLPGDEQAVAQLLSERQGWQFIRAGSASGSSRTTIASQVKP